jgi:hypothetical protein
LHVEPSPQDRRYSLEAEEIEILTDFEDAEDGDPLYFYIDPGDTDSRERAVNFKTLTSRDAWPATRYPAYPSKDRRSDLATS